MLISRRTHSAPSAQAALYVGEELASYGFPDGHPLGADRQDAFYREAAAQGLLEKVSARAPRLATREEIERFHTQRYVDKVRGAERDRLDYLDNGDTPVFPGVYRASATVVGSALDGLARIMAGECIRTFQPIGGLHHAGRDHAAGFCVFNDLGVVIETLRSRYAIRRVAYVDIDVHHGDGIFYAFEADPELIFADIHEDGNHLYPGTGRADETGKGRAKGTKLNIPLAPHSGDKEFTHAWPRVIEHLSRFEPEFVVFQCGADGLKGDPLAHLEYSAAVHAQAAQSLVQIAKRYCAGRLMAFGGGGYDRGNLGRAWSAVLRAIT
ncbi:MAG TPA: acetoin utilization protein AcuC [Burkholderiales bacterium]|jgi:acetoin utilization protein AcuC|nr:acetoin utilization protein AcuC [Burkholderiales bacterium]